MHVIVATLHLKISMYSSESLLDIMVRRSSATLTLGMIESEFKQAVLVTVDSDSTPDLHLVIVPAVRQCNTRREGGCEILENQFSNSYYA